MYHPHTWNSIQQAHRPVRCLISQVSFSISATNPSAHLRTDTDEDTASLLYNSMYHPRTRNSIQGTHRPLGCLISPVSFRQSTINHSAILWKLTCKEKYRILRDFATLFSNLANWSCHQFSNMVRALVCNSRSCGSALGVPRWNYIMVHHANFFKITRSLVHNSHSCGSALGVPRWKYIMEPHATYSKWWELLCATALPVAAHWVYHAENTSWYTTLYFLKWWDLWCATALLLVGRFCKRKFTTERGTVLRATVLQDAALFCIVLQCVAECCSELQNAQLRKTLCYEPMCCSVLQRVATSCRTHNWGRHCAASHSVAACCSVLQSVAACCRAHNGESHTSLRTTLNVREPHIGMGWLRLVGSLNYKSLVQNIVSFIGLFCKRDL